MLGQSVILTQNEERPPLYLALLRVVGKCLKHSFLNRLIGIHTRRRQQWHQRNVLLWLKWRLLFPPPQFASLKIPLMFEPTTPKPGEGVAVRVETTDHSCQTPPLLSRLFHTHLEGTGADPSPHRNLDHGGRAPNCDNCVRVLALCIGIASRATDTYQRLPLTSQDHIHIAWPSQMSMQDLPGRRLGLSLWKFSESAPWWKDCMQDPWASILANGIVCGLAYVLADWMLGCFYCLSLCWTFWGPGRWSWRQQDFHETSKNPCRSWRG